jgi:hypothetical protein
MEPMPDIEAIIERSNTQRAITTFDEAATYAKQVEADRDGLLLLIGLRGKIEIKDDVMKLHDIAESIGGAEGADGSFLLGIACLIEDQRRVLSARSYLEQGVRNILFNIEQSPERHTVTELLTSLRSALGLKPGDRP